MKSIFVKELNIRPKQFQFFMNQFIQSLIDAGVKSIRDYSQKEKIKKVVSIAYLCTRRIGLWKSPAKGLIVASRGDKLLERAYPYYFEYEIIPMLWDVWPAYQSKLIDDLHTLKCKIVFVTVKSFAKKLNEELGIKAYWIPEGIKISDYDGGKNLVDRPWDVYELGRQLKSYDIVLTKLAADGKIQGLHRNSYDIHGKLEKLAFPDAPSLIQNLANFKIIICFPKTITHPEDAGGIDTLTQRYWEAMLSRCLIIGSAPAELIEIAGYNPVIEVDFGNPYGQLEDILTHISDYQDLVDRNYKFAIENASWHLRADKVIKILLSEGYLIN